ncbi:MAG: alpha/beta hydrolase [Bacteriovoracaceae bacterium]|nr:alpha/beta hydrolase [Bacteriovoracaceae bacterium]
MVNDSIKEKLHIVGSGRSPNKMVCVHGGPGMDYSYFLPYLRQLSFDMDLIFFKSGSIYGKGSIDLLVKEVIHVLQYFKGTNLFLLGHSFGSAIALEAIKETQEYVNGLLLVSWIFNNTIRDYSNFTPLDNYSDSDFQRDSLRSISSYFVDSCINKGHDTLRKVSYDGNMFAKLEADYLVKFDLTDSLKNLTIPTISLAGIKDDVVPIKHIKDGLKISSITHIDFEHSKHFPFIEENEKFTNVVKKFISNATKGAK